MRGSLFHHTEYNLATCMPFRSLFVHRECLERGSTVSKMGRIWPESINVPIWISLSRLGSTTNQTGRTSRVFASAKEGCGLTTETRTPPGFTTCQDRCKVSPPTKSKTRSTSCTTSSKRVVVKSMISLAPNSSRKSRLLAEVVAMTCAPAQRANWTAKTPHHLQLPGSRRSALRRGSRDQRVPARQ